MTKITYKEVEGRRGSWSIRVYHDDIYVGDIKLVEGGFAYFARGGRGGLMADFIY